MEKWKYHPEYEGYEASNLGRVRSNRRAKPRILLGGKDKDGYRKFIVHQGGGKVKHVRVANFVAECWIGKRPINKVTCHKDGNKENNAPQNLEYKTQKENIHDKYTHGTIARGIKNPRSALTEEQVIKIFTSDTPAEVLVEQFNLRSRAAIDAIRKQKTWTHITKDLTQPARQLYQRRWKKRPADVR
jgi:hypothetical protein